MTRSKLRMTKALYIIVLDAPDRTLSPNARTHWAKKARAVKQARLASCLRTKYAISKQNIKVGNSVATIKRVFYFKDNRRRDKDNFNAMTKSVTDGLVDANLLVDDDKITWLPTDFITDKHIIPRLEYHIYKLA